MSSVRQEANIDFTFLIKKNLHTSKKTTTKKKKLKKKLSKISDWISSAKFISP